MYPTPSNISSFKIHFINIFQYYVKILSCFVILLKKQKSPSKMKLSTHYFNNIRDHKCCGKLPYYTLMVQRDHFNIHRVEKYMETHLATYYAE